MPSPDVPLRLSKNPPIATVLIDRQRHQPDPHNIDIGALLKAHGQLAGGGSPSTESKSPDLPNGFSVLGVAG